ncbi:adenosine 5'-monophosphoramidase HINT3-like [Aulostomus maculatus]
MERKVSCPKPCIFCFIASGEDEMTKVIRKNEELVCFWDIFPAAPIHLLVVPTWHIVNCLSLHRRHIGLVERMVEMGKAALQDVGVTDMNDIRLGFHQPPYISVDHLHLHVLAPASKISSLLEYKFIPRTESFIDEYCLRECLKDISPPDKCPCV